MDPILPKREDRRSESIFVERVSRVAYSSNVRDIAEPDGTWDFVFRIRLGQVQVLQTGQIDRPILLDYEAGDSYLGIAFKPDVYMPRLPGSAMARRGVFHPLANKCTFYVGIERLEIPTFDNAERFVAQLVSRGIIVRDPLVGRAIEGGLEGLNDRTLQRHFAHVTGMTGKAFQQIFRANRAIKMLSGGQNIADVAVTLGYTDQSHLTRSLHRIVGRTPGQVVRSPMSSYGGCDCSPHCCPS